MTGPEEAERVVRAFQQARLVGQEAIDGANDAAAQFIQAVSGMMGKVADVFAEWRASMDEAFARQLEQYYIARGWYEYPLFRQLLRRGWPGRLAYDIAYHVPARWLPWLLYDETLDVPMAVLGRC